MSYVKETKTTVESRATVCLDRTCADCGATIRSIAAAISSGTYTAGGTGNYGDALRAKEIADAGLEKAGREKIAEMEKQLGTYGVLCSACAKYTAAFGEKVESAGGMRLAIQRLCNPEPWSEYPKMVILALVFVLVGGMMTYYGFTQEREGFVGDLLVASKILGILFIGTGVLMAIGTGIESNQSEANYRPYRERVEALDEEDADRIARSAILASGNTWTEETRKQVFATLDQAKQTT